MLTILSPHPLEEETHTPRKGAVTRPFPVPVPHRSPALCPPVPQPRGEKPGAMNTLHASPERLASHRNLRSITSSATGPCKVTYIKFPASNSCYAVLAVLKRLPINTDSYRQWSPWVLLMRILCELNSSTLLANTLDMNDANYWLR